MDYPDDEVTTARWRQKMRAAGLMGPSESTSQGLHVAGLRGSAPRNVERDARIAAMHSAGETWAAIGRALGVAGDAARKAWLRHEARRGREYPGDTGGGWI